MISILMYTWNDSHGQQNCVTEPYVFLYLRYLEHNFHCWKNDLLEHFIYLYVCVRGYYYYKLMQSSKETFPPWYIWYIYICIYIYIYMVYISIMFTTTGLVVSVVRGKQRHAPTKPLCVSVKCHGDHKTVA